MINFQFKKFQRGFSLVEMIIYIGILALMLTIIVNMLFIMSTSGRALVASKNIENAGAFSLERVTREIRNASSVDAGQSVLGSSPGVLALNGTDLNGSAHTIKFLLSSNSLHVVDNGVDQGSLTGVATKVTNLVFTQVVTPNSQAIRIQMTIESGTSTAYKSENFYTTTIMRGSL
jgi:prepilin-type N-terminal cleavage/methylation domain-containing protein